ncbi:MAG: fructose bisphosphate aldolase [Rhodobacteraceae bacterium]|nr:fructose bisphosphate aldolase [Paracoccaceae bacterium]
MANDGATQTAQLQQMQNGAGFIAALDQSGGSTPKALGLYGVTPDAWSDDAGMFAQMQKMRARIILADDFTSAKVIGAILFERTMDETIEGKQVAEFMWSERGVVPFLKIDKGLEGEANGVQMMKDIPDLADTLARAKGLGVYGTKMRSVINTADATGIEGLVAQQFEVAKEVIAAGLMPIIEPEINIHSDTKAAAEVLMKSAIATQLDALPEGQGVMLKLTIPDQANLYSDLSDHPRVIRIVALSGGYSTDDACARLSRNDTMIASFSRALTEGLNVSMSDAVFNSALGSNIDKIYQASV